MKHVHPSNKGPGHVTEHAIEWPALPWTCPVCEFEFSSHKYTIATVPNPETPENIALATFKCVGCDIAVFARLERLGPFDRS